MTSKPYDPMEGVTSKSTKEDLMERLRRAAAALRRADRSQKARLQEIEERLRAKGEVTQEHLKFVIVGATEPEWQDSIEFLEEFEEMLPIALQRQVLGGRVLLGQHEAAG